MEETYTKISTGVKGLDEILDGGLIEGKSYLLTGGPGSGKTTIGLHFVSAASRDHEKSVFITLSEPESQIKQNAKYLNINIDNIAFLDLSPKENVFSDNQAYDIFSPSEVEREPMTEEIINIINREKPSRVFVDSLTQMRYMLPDLYQFRKQVLSFIKFLTDRGITCMFTSEATMQYPDDDLQFMCDGVVHLHNSSGNRYIEVTKFRGSECKTGSHIMKLSNKGAEVFPKLLPDELPRKVNFEKLGTGISDLDLMFGGGIERSTTTIITGPSGVGKTTLGVQLMKEAAGRDEKSAVYSFEENPEILIERCESIQIPVREMIDKGTLIIKHIEPILYSPDEFAYMLRKDISDSGVKMVMIDSISGYRLSMKGGNELISHLHSLCKYLSNMGVTIILINELENITGGLKATDIGISYLADNIIYMKYIELHGEMKKTIGVLKKRLSNFENSLREFQITDSGIKVTKPLTNLRNILSGNPKLIKEDSKK